MLLCFVVFNVEEIEMEDMACRLPVAEGVEVEEEQPIEIVELDSPPEPRGDVKVEEENEMVELASWPETKKKVEEEKPMKMIEMTFRPEAVLKVKVETHDQQATQDEEVA